MRIYQNLYEAFKETERELVEMGIDVHPETMQDKDVKGNADYSTKELQGYGYKIVDPNLEVLDKDLTKLGGNNSYAVAEYGDRIDQYAQNPGTSWKWRMETWKPFLDKDGRFSYTYNERFREQLYFIIAELMKRPGSRQAVMTMYDRHQDMANIGGSKRIPCSMYYQFLIRERNGIKYLDSIYTMRSCDIYTHFIYDVWLAINIQSYIAKALKLELGHFTHFMGSLHAYKKDYSTKGVF